MIIANATSVKCIFATNGIYLYRMDSMDFWHRFNSQVRLQNTTQEWIATKAGVNVATLRSWIARRRLPRVDEAYALAQALEVSLEWLLTGEHSQIMPPSPEIHRLFQDILQLTSDERVLVDAAVSGLLQQRRRALYHRAEEDTG